MEQKNKRLAKVHALWRPGKIVKQDNYNRGKDVPWLNLNGNWLEAAGFRIGDQIEIDVQQKQLVIRKVRRKRAKMVKGQV